MRNLQLAMLQKRTDAVMRCSAKYHLPPNPAIDEALLRFPGTPDRPSRKLAVLLLAYKREVSIRDLGRVSDQSWIQIRALRNDGFRFQGDGSNPFLYVNADGERCRKILGFTPPRQTLKPQAAAILETSIATCVTAIEAYNKSNFAYREETWSLLLVHAWELLLKAKIVFDNNDAVESIQARDPHGTPQYGRSGNLLTVDLRHCLAILAHHQHLSRNARTNLEMLLEVRDNAIHYRTKDHDFRTKVQAIGVASLKNYVTAVDEWFNKDLSAANFYLLPLSVVQTADAAHGSASRPDQALQNLLTYFQTMEGAGIDHGDDRYAITLHLTPQFVRVAAPDDVGTHERPDEESSRSRW